MSGKLSTQLSRPRLGAQELKMNNSSNDLQDVWTVNEQNMRPSSDIMKKPGDQAER